MPAPWMEALDVSAKPTPADALAFFGVPPDPEDRLDDNIGKKRRYWSRKTRTAKVSDKAERKVQQALRLIEYLEQYVKRGVVEDIDLETLREEFSGAPKTTVDSLDELWRVVEELLVSGRLDEALRVANEARTRFAGERIADAAFGWLASVASRTDLGTDVMRREGLAAVRRAIDAGERTPDAFGAAAILQMDLGDAAGAVAALDEARAALNGSLTPWLWSYRCEAYGRLGRVEEAGRSAVEAVTAAPDDLGLRSNTVEALIIALRTKLLPITSHQALQSYREIAELAAWCAQGAPAAEDQVRPYRMWGVQAGTMAYSGRIDLRSIMAVLTGFAILPLLNRWRSKPHWQVFVEGPGSVRPEIFPIVALGGIPLYVHEGLMDRVPWRPQDIEEPPVAA